MENEQRYQWLRTLIKIVVIFGLLWLSNEFYPHEKLSWLIVIATVLVFEWFVQPRIERWFKDVVKQAMREKQVEDDGYAQQQMLDDE